MSGRDRPAEPRAREAVRGVGEREDPLARADQVEILIALWPFPRDAGPLLHVAVGVVLVDDERRTGGVDHRHRATFQDQRWSCRGHIWHSKWPAGINSARR